MIKKSDGNGQGDSQLSLDFNGCNSSANPQTPSNVVLFDAFKKASALSASAKDMGALPTPPRDSIIQKLIDRAKKLDW